MKNLNLILFLFLSLFLFSCHSKPEIKEQQQTRNEYTIQNYKLDDDELAKRKTEAAKIDEPIKKKKLLSRKK
jgi:PBP1b-binding outer membrane lipoprotein LpoB